MPVAELRPRMTAAILDLRLVPFVSRWSRTLLGDEPAPIASIAATLYHIKVTSVLTPSMLQDLEWYVLVMKSNTRRYPISEVADET